MNTYTIDSLEKAKRIGDVTDNGVAYQWWLSGPQGASFAVMREPHHTDEDILRARRQIRADHDVVQLLTYVPIKIKGAK